MSCIVTSFNRHLPTNAFSGGTVHPLTRNVIFLLCLIDNKQHFFFLIIGLCSRQYLGFGEIFTGVQKHFFFFKLFRAHYGHRTSVTEMKFNPIVKPTNAV